MRNWYGYGFVISALVLALACVEPPTTRQAVTIVRPDDFGSGVYYFNTAGAELGKSLAVFLKETSCKIEGFTGNSYGSHGDYGYWVICR